MYTIMRVKQSRVILAGFGVSELKFTCKFLKIGCLRSFFRNEYWNQIDGDVDAVDVERY